MSEHPRADADDAARPSRRAAIAIASLIVACTVLGLAGTDLVLPAIPALPEALGGGIGEAQLVLATFTAGTGTGLLLFGELGARLGLRRMLVAALLAYAATSALAALASSLPLLIGLRFLQGVAAACPAVVAPGIVRALFDEPAALRALGVLGSIESLAPAIAPIVGVWLLQQGGWAASFSVTACLALVLALVVAAVGRHIPAVAGNRARFGYPLLLRNGVFQRYALSQGFALASLLVFVFAMPAVFVYALDGSIGDFIAMQLLGIASFIVAANLASHLVERLGAEAVIFGGSALTLAACLAMFAYGVSGGRDPTVIWLLFLPLNMGFGFRGPPGFLLALQASRGDDARASALVVLYVMLFTAAGTALLAPLVGRGLWPAALVASALGAASITTLRLLPPLAVAGAAGTRRMRDPQNGCQRPDALRDQS